jgi:hypothetical protein
MHEPFHDGPRIRENSLTRLANCLPMLIFDNVHSTVAGRLVGTHFTSKEEIIPKPKLSPEGEVIAAYGAAMVAAIQVLINCP